ncbi:CapA family protein [Ornithinimicrobium sp. W1665]|uniref:CapA family protein n=1 Tax=Ornithinimicrobium sp. W1665 TaxID=3416666 RepID=UPI003CE9EC3A
MRRTSSTATAAAVALLLAACAGGDEQGGEDGSGGTSTAVPAPAPAPEDEGSQDEEDAADAADDEAADDEDDAPQGVSPPATSLDEADDGEAGGPLEVTIAAAGDILAHSRLNLTANAYAGGAAGAYDYTPMFEDVSSPISEADLALCHLETPLSPDNTNLSVPDTLVFNTPREMADALAGAGFDGCDFASNHTMDMGVSGLAATEQVVRDAGMGYAGPTADEDRSGLAEVYEVEAEGGPARIAHLAYTYTYPNSGTPTTDVPGEAPWLVDASWPNLGSEGILEQASAARQEGADFVVVSMHWGNEYQAQPTEDQTRIARDLLGSGDVDLVLGTHVHVIQPCEEVDGRHVIYGLGNFLSNQSPDTNANLLPATQEGMVATFTLTRDEEGGISSRMDYQPTRVEIVPGPQPGPHVIRLVSPETYPETWERTTATVDLLGGCGAEPLEP